jgi:hypothetical protein
MIYLKFLLYSFKKKKTSLRNINKRKVIMWALFHCEKGILNLIAVFFFPYSNMGKGKLQQLKNRKWVNNSNR